MNTSWADNVESEMLSDNKENSSPAQAKETVANKGKTTIEKSQHIDYQNKHIESDKKHVTENHDDNVSQTSSSTIQIARLIIIQKLIPLSPNSGLTCLPN